MYSFTMGVTNRWPSSKFIDGVLFALTTFLKPCLASKPEREKLFAVLVNDF